METDPKPEAPESLDIPEATDRAERTGHEEDAGTGEQTDIAGSAGSASVEPPEPAQPELPDQPERPEAEASDTTPRRTSRDVLYEAIAIDLVNAGVLTPAHEFVDRVRQAAGFRVSPREVAVAVARIAQSGQPVTVDQVVEVVHSSRGDRSTRQQRHAEEWRALGAILTLRGLDGSPEGQRAFIGEARSTAGSNVGDVLLLRVALALAEHGAALDARTIGQLASRLASSAADLSPDDILAVVPQELRALARARREQSRRPAKRSSSGARRQQQQPSTSSRHRKPGRPYRTIRRRTQRG